MSKIQMSFVLVFFISLFAKAEMGVPIQLRLKSPAGTYPTDAGLNFKLLVLSPSSNCILRDEDFSGQSINDGAISLTLGTGARGTNDPALSLNQVYDNSIVKTGLSCVDANNTVVSSSQSYTPAVGDHRVIRVVTSIAADTIIANFNMRATPYAIHAESVGGKLASQIVVNDITTQMNQINLNDLLFDVTRFNNLKSIAVSGVATTATQFSGLLAGDVGGTQGATSVDKIKGIAVSAAAPTTGDVLQYNGTQYVPVAIASAPVSSVAGRIGAVILSSTDISGLGNAAGLDVGTTAGTVAAGNDSRIVNALQTSSSLIGDVTGTPSATVVSAVGGKTSSQVSAAVDDSIAATSANTASTIVKRDASGNVSVTGLSAVNNSTNNIFIYDVVNSVRLKASAGLAANYILTLPPDDGTTGQVLQTDGSGILSWTSGGTVTSVTASPPLASSGGANPNITIATANTTTTGVITSTDWTTFNNKQNAGNYMTALTGDVTAAGPGSSAATIAVNAVTTAKINVLAVTIDKINDVAWSKVSGTPTTLFGYGITDAASTTLTNGKIRIGNGSNIAAEQNVSGDATMNNTGVLTLASTAVGAGTFGSSTAVPIFTVDAKGRLTAAGSSAYQDATAVGKGIVQVGTGLSVASGTISVNYGTSGTTAAVGNDARFSDARTPSGTAGGDLSGTYPNPAVDRIKGTSVSAAATASGQFLIYNGTSQYVPSVLSGDAAMTSGGVMTIGTGAVTSGKILDGTLADADISGSAAITAIKIGGGLVDNTELSYLDGATSNVQTQLAARVPLSGGTMTGTLITRAPAAGAGTAPLKLPAGTVMATPEAGAVESTGTSLYYTDSTATRRTVSLKTVITKTVTQVVNNSTTFVNDNAFTFAGAANTRYLVKLIIKVNNSNRAMANKWTFALPSGTMELSGINVGANNNPGGSWVSGASGTLPSPIPNLSATANNQIFMVEGLISVGATGGAVTFRWAQNVAAAFNLSFLAGSYMTYEPL